MAAVVARLEKRSAEAETPTETFELECEHAHKSHRQSRSSGQSNRQRPRQRGHGFQAPQQRQRKDGGVTAYAAEGYQLHRFPQQTQSFQAQAQHMRDYHEDHTCPQCQRRHLDACQRVIGVCSTCEEVGHIQLYALVGRSNNTISISNSSSSIDHCNNRSMEDHSSSREACLHYHNGHSKNHQPNLNGTGGGVTNSYGHSKDSKANRTREANRVKGVNVRVSRGRPCYSGGHCTSAERGHGASRWTGLGCLA